MTETFAEGDLVEAVKEEGESRTEYRGRVHAGGHSFAGTDLAAWDLKALPRLGYTLTVIEKASPPLPTTPGYYGDKNGGLWEITERSFRAIDAPPCSGWFDASHAAEYAPFNRLAPVAEVLGKIRAQAIAVTESRDAPYLAIDIDRFDAIAAEYGATK